MSERERMDDPLDAIGSNDGFLDCVPDTRRNRMGIPSKKPNVGWWHCLLAYIRIRWRSYLWAMLSRISNWIPESYLTWAVNSVSDGFIWEQELAGSNRASDTCIIRVKRRLDYEIGLRVCISLLPIRIALILMVSLFVSLINVSRLSPASHPEKKPQTGVHI